MRTELGTLRAIAVYASCVSNTFYISTRFCICRRDECLRKFFLSLWKSLLKIKNTQLAVEPAAARWHLFLLDLARLLVAATQINTLDTSTRLRKSWLYDDAKRNAFAWCCASPRRSCYFSHSCWYFIPYLSSSITGLGFAIFPFPFPLT